MTALTNEKQSPTVTEALHGYSKLAEAIRRYKLPFGMNGKHRTFQQIHQGEPRKKANSLVLQDFRVLTPAEYIFGLHPADCVSLTVDVTNYRSEYALQTNMLAERFNPNLIIVAIPKHCGITASTLKKFSLQLQSQFNWIQNPMNSFQVKMYLCQIDEKIRDIDFVEY
jgi:hypothetical protein